jgi:exonuclease III
LNQIDPDINFFDGMFASYNQPAQSSYYTIEEFNLIQPKKSCFTVMSFNIRSFSANSDQFILMLKSLRSQPDVIILSETWLSESAAAYCSMEGYDSYHTVRDGGRGGGVSVFSRVGMIVSEVKHLSICSRTIESCVVKIELGSEKYCIFAIYRPHADTIDNFSVQVEGMLRDDALVNSRVILAGDLNINLLSQNCNHVTNFVSCMQSLHFLPTITKPTRFPSNEQLGVPSLLDHIWFNSLCSYNTGIFSIDITDHCPTFIKIHIPIEPNEKIKLTFRIHSPANVNNFIDTLSKSPFNFSDPEHVNEQTELFINTVNSIYCSCFPLMTKFVGAKRLQKPWLSADLLKSINIKSRNFKMSKLGLISEEHKKSFSNALGIKIKIAKRHYYKNSFENCLGDIKKTWILLKKILMQKSDRKPIKKIICDGLEVIDDLDIANSFNNYFANIAEELDSQLLPVNDSPLDYLKRNVPNSYFVSPVSLDECNSIILGIKKSSFGLNSLPVKICILARHLIVKPLSELINNSFQVGIFPDILKRAQITPVFKSGDPQMTSNYRPISVLPLFSKVFEKCMATRLISFIDRFSLISSCQFGFIKKVSTVDALISFSEYVYGALNERNHCISVFIDLRKAFDTVNHAVLLQKLNCYGVRGLPLGWLTSYLSNRQQCVKIGARLSNYKIINIGVPQGSILGPLLFLFYVNDLPDVSSKLASVLFADDTTLSAKHTNFETLITEINVELVKIKHWTLVNRLSVNVEKTFVMLFSNRRQGIDHELKVYFDEKEVKFHDSGKFLGIHVDRDLKFDVHISEICKKLSKSVGLLYKVSSSVPEKELINLYYSLVYPYLLYCNIVWGGTFSTHLAPLLLLQKKIIRILTSQPYLAHTDPLFHRAGILKLDDIHRYQLALHAFKIKSRAGFPPINHRYLTRNREDFVPPFQRLSLTQHSVSFAAPSVWNALPSFIKECSSTHSFRKALKFFIINSYNAG